MFIEQVDNIQTKIILLLRPSQVRNEIARLLPNCKTGQMFRTTNLPTSQFLGSTHSPAAFVLPLGKEFCPKRRPKVCKKQEIFHICLHFMMRSLVSPVHEVVCTYVRSHPELALPCMGRGSSFVVL